MAAKALLFMAYKQDARHQVVEVDKKILERALVYINEITDQEGGNVGLCEMCIRDRLSRKYNKHKIGYKYETK